jgi:hypothetical protein
MKDFRLSRQLLLRMASSAMLRRVTLVRTEVSEERSTSIIRVTRISELGTTLAITSNPKQRRICEKLHQSDLNLFSC